mgnify:CR=1 FL=1
MEREFDEKIKIISENYPEFPYKEAHWKALEKQLNQKSDVNVKSCWLKTYWLFLFKNK